MGGILGFLQSFVMGIIARETPVVVEGLAGMANAATVDLEKLVTKGLPIAIKYVGENAAKVISGEEKFGEAVTATWQELQADPHLGGLVQHDIHMLVQMAYRLGGKAVHALKG